MPVGNKSPTWSPGWCSSARQVPPELCSLTQIHAGAIFGSPVLQQQHDPDRGVTPNLPSRGSFRMSGAQRQKRRLMNKGLLLALDVSVGAAQTHRVPSPGGTTLTTFHRSLTRESTLRMSACSVPPLILPAERGRCPHCLRPTLTCSLRPGLTFGLSWRTLPRPETHTPHKNNKVNCVHTFMVTTEDSD